MEALHILQENKFVARVKFCLEKSFVDDNEFLIEKKIIKNLDFVESLVNNKIHPLYFECCGGKPIEIAKFFCCKGKPKKR